MQYSPAFIQESDEREREARERERERESRQAIKIDRVKGAKNSGRGKEGGLGQGKFMVWAGGMA